MDYSSISLFYICQLAVICVAAERMFMHKDERKIAQFDVKPGTGEQEFKLDWDGQFTCTFYYKAQGGTKEQWSMRLYRNNQLTDWECVVDRPTKSYLFFESFKVVVDGAHLREVFIQKETGVEELPAAEYNVVHESNYVKHQEGKFQSQLQYIEVFASKARPEL